MIASDGFLEGGRGHPRTSGTNAKVLGTYVREDGMLTLMDALRRMTIDPAQRLEAYVPAMATKGRVRVGADADITIFDAATVIDHATYTNPTLPPEGIHYVLVNGEPVVADGALLPDARPGQRIRVR
jgi:dihydroorotase